MKTSTTMKKCGCVEVCFVWFSDIIFWQCDGGGGSPTFPSIWTPPPPPPYLIYIFQKSYIIVIVTPPQIVMMVVFVNDQLLRYCESDARKIKRVGWASHTLKEIKWGIAGSFWKDIGCSRKASGLYHKFRQVMYCMLFKTANSCCIMWPLLLSKLCTALSGQGSLLCM